MTFRQTLLKWVYPLLLRLGKLKGGKQIRVNTQKQRAMQSFYDLEIPLNTNKVLQMGSLKGKKILLVNTASNCGYTNQYSELQKLYEQHQGKLEIIGFPANDFKEQ